MRRPLLNSLLTVLLSAIFITSAAQNIGVLTGNVTDKETGQPFGSDYHIQILSFDNVDAAVQAKEVFSSNPEADVNAVEITAPDKYGFYSIRVHENGAVLFKDNHGLVILEEVNGRAKLDMTITKPLSVNASLVAANPNNILMVNLANENVGGYLKAARFIKLPQKRVKSDRCRVTIWPYLIDAETTDTLAKLMPQVYEGNKYRKVKSRKGHYNTEKDTLSRYGSKEIHDDSVVWSDSILIKNTLRSYQIVGKLQVTDLRDKIVYSRDSITLASARVRKPMRFLDYSVASVPFELDPEKYKVYEENIPAEFLVNSAELDSKGSGARMALDQFRDRIVNVATGENSKLLEFGIEYVASPDGPYEKNIELGYKRVSNISEYIKSAVPRRILDRVYCPSGVVKVASWNDVADKLEERGMSDMAAEVRAIVKGDDNRDNQWQKVRELPYYKTSISPVLSELRTIKLRYKSEEIAANQLYQYLMTDNFKEAYAMAQMLPDTEEFNVLKAFVMCSGGYYQGGDTPEEREQRKEWFDLVANSSSQNKVVMLLAMNTPLHTLQAEKELESWPDNSALKWYLKAVVSSRKSSYQGTDFMEPMYFEEYLVKCFDLNPDFIRISRNDGDIDENLLKDFFKYNTKYDK